MSQHVDIWERKGYEVENEVKEKLRKPVQEALMKLFAVSIIYLSL